MDWWSLKRMGVECAGEQWRSCTCSRGEYGLVRGIMSIRDDCAKVFFGNLDKNNPLTAHRSCPNKVSWVKNVLKVHLLFPPEHGFRSASYPTTAILVEDLKDVKIYGGYH